MKVCEISQVDAIFGTALLDWWEFLFNFLPTLGEPTS